MLRRNCIVWFILFAVIGRVTAQENFFGHYFIAASSTNPALAGDTRFAQFQLAERIQPTVSSTPVTHTLLTWDQKLRNHRSGIAVSVDERRAQFRELQARINYSYTLLLFRKYWLKAGLGVSFNSLNTHASGYTFPDQYNNYGFTGMPTQEIIDREKVIYPGLSAGFAAYTENAWFSAGVDNLNRPGLEIIGDRYRVPLMLGFSAGYLIPLDKDNRPKRLFSPRGGLIPWSSIGPVAGFYKYGPFHVMTLGVNGFTNPVFWGVNFRYNAVYNQFLKQGASSIHFMAGYRVESFSLAYSYDYMINRSPTYFTGIHEISFIYYIYSVKEDYRKNKLVPFTNQLMY